MKIKRKEYKQLTEMLASYLEMMTSTRLVIEVPGSLGPEAEPFDIPPMVPVIDVTLEHMAYIAKFGGYDNHVGEVLRGPFTIRFLTTDVENPPDRILYHRYTVDGRTVITREAKS